MERHAVATLAGVLAALPWFILTVPPAVQVHRPKVAAGIDPAEARAPRWESLRLTAADGTALAAVWFPPRMERAPAVLFLHGIGAEKSLYYASYARLLHAWGYGVLCLDIRGHGDSDGHVQTFGVRETADVRAAVAWLRSRPDVLPERVAVLGHSMGGAIALVAASEIPEVRAVVADAAYHDLREIGADRLRFWGAVPRPLAEATLRATLLLGRVLGDVDPRGRQPIDRIPAIAPRPVLLVHGDADRSTPPEASQALRDAAGETATLLLLPGVGHRRDRDRFPAALEEPLRRFLARALGDVGP